MLEQIIRRDHEDSENSMLSAIERRGGGESDSKRNSETTYHW
jgi:hypothetical protein